VSLKLRPEKFCYSLGGFGTETETVEWLGDQLVYLREFGFGQEPLEKIVCQPSELEWQRFWGQVRNCGVKYWRHENQSDIFDGVQWSLDIESEELAVHCFGSNSYPPRGTQDPSEAFKQFLKALAILLQSKKLEDKWYYGVSHAT